MHETPFKSQSVNPSDDASNKALSGCIRSLILCICPEAIELPGRDEKSTQFSIGPDESQQFCWLRSGRGYVTIGFNYASELRDDMRILHNIDGVYYTDKISSVGDLFCNPPLVGLLQQAVAGVRRRNGITLSVL
ncbi:MAG TPA: hypothetical protein VGD40_02450 [Chryseosolibacter sp.]